MAILEITDVTAGYGAGPDILTGLSLEVEEAKSYCIIGPNGAGKSTLFKVIAGLLNPRSGDVVFRGESLAHRRPDQVLASGVCFVPQDQALFPEMSVRENLVMGAYLVKDPPSSRSASTGCTRCSPSSRIGPARTPARCRADSSRCWPWVGR